MNRRSIEKILNKYWQDGDNLEKEVIHADDKKDLVNDLFTLFTMQGIVNNKITVLLTYNETEVVFGFLKTTKKTKIIEVDDLKDLNKLGDNLVDAKILK